MKNKHNVYILLLLVFAVLINIRGHYKRNIQVDEFFLNTIAEVVVQLEDKRINDSSHSYDDYREFRRILNDGEMGENSNAEIEIGFAAQGLSKFLYEYYESPEKRVSENSEDALVRYMNTLMDLKTLLLPYRESNVKVDELWLQGVFNDK